MNKMTHNKPIEEIGLRDKNGSAELALARMRAMIQSGRFPKQGQLPPERELAEELQVGRSTLRKALDVLEAEGHIWRHVGQGTFLGKRQPNDQTAPLLDLQGVTPKELLDARLVIEPSVAACAAITAQPSDIVRMKECAEKRENAKEPEPYNLWDHRLHLTIAEATRNPILIALLEQLNSLRRTPNWSDYKTTRMGEPYHSKSAREHREIIAAIEKRDANAAFRAMREHIVNVQEGFFDWSDSEKER